MPIQQHPLPQDISSYRFRLIGDMTIKQFASLAISIILSLITYSLPLPFFFKYPLAFIFFALGIGMAFVPVQGRTLDVWILAFIKSIYSPTQYTWKKTTETAEASPTPVQNGAVPATATHQIEIYKPVAPIVPVTPVTATPAVESVVIAPQKTPISIVQPSTKEDLTSKVPETPAVVAITPAPSTIISPTKPTVITPPTTMQLPVPFTPTTPNTLVGLTLTPDGRILDGVLVEIQKNGLTSRATKSNKLGQFMFARPLESGNIQILAEKDGYEFAPYSLELKGEIVRPLKIQAET